MIRFGQILFSIKGFPEKASNLKKQIFEKYYDLLFGEDNLEIEKSDEYILQFYKIKKALDENKKGYLSTEQKVFYLMYMHYRLDKSIEQLIEILQKQLTAFHKTLDLPKPEARLLISVNFKNYLDNKLKFKN